MCECDITYERALIKILVVVGRVTLNVSDFQFVSSSSSSQKVTFEEQNVTWNAWEEFSKIEKNVTFFQTKSKLIVIYNIFSGYSRFDT